MVISHSQGLPTGRYVLTGVHGQGGQRATEAGFSRSATQGSLPLCRSASSLKALPPSTTQEV